MMRAPRSLVAPRRCRVRLSWRCSSRSSSSSAAAVSRAVSNDNDNNDNSNDNNNNNTTNPHFPHLFQPLKLDNGMVLPNRVLMGSMHTGLEGHCIPRLLMPVLNTSAGSNGAGSNGDKNHHHHHNNNHLHAMADYMSERARGGVGLMVTGGIAPNREGWTGPFAAKLSTRQEMEQHKVVTEAVHACRVVPMVTVAAGAQPTSVIGQHTTNTTTTTTTTTLVAPKICMQILHAGRYGYHPLAVSASDTKSPISPYKSRGLTKAGVQGTIADFVHCATLAKTAGYDGVEIMGSEGYLISQFLCIRTNRRTDEYGGDSFQNRMRLALEIIRNTRKAVGTDFIIIFRLSLLDLVQDGMSWDECLLMAQAVEDAGASMINTGIGWHEARVPTIATSVPRAAFARPTHLLKQANVVNIPIVATNRINSPHVAEELLESGVADMVSMARPFLADPDIVNKSREGRTDEINTCIACNQACLDHAFVAKTASCLVNPRACQETNLKVAELPQDQRLNIGVIGAGPAGCAFALTAAQMGHGVTLYDKSGEIGGQFNMAKRVPGKEEFHETLRYFRTMLKKHGVHVKLNTDMTLKDMEEIEMDKWIVATGVDPRVPDIPGIDHPSVLSYIDVLRNNAPVGKKVAIVGAGGIGFDVAEFLLHHDGTDKTPNDVGIEEFWEEWGVDPTNGHRGGLVPKKMRQPKREIVLCQRKKGKLGAKLGKTTGWIHRATLKSQAVEMVDNVSYKRVDENGNLIIEREGEERVLEVDNVIMCAGQLEQHDLEIHAKDNPALVDRVFTIGGAFQAGELDAKRAIDMGTRLATKIHDESVVPGEHRFEAPMGAEEKLYKLLKRWI